MTVKKDDPKKPSRKNGKRNSYKDDDDYVSIKSLEDHHYYLFNTDFDQSSCGDFIRFVLERSLMNPADRPKQIKLIINSPGGDLTSAFAMIDVMKGSPIDVHTYGLGQISSCGLIAFIAGKKGKRFITPNTSIMSHQFTWGTFGKEHELFATVKEFDLTAKRLIEHYKKCTGLSEKDVRKYLLPEKDVYLDAKEAIKLGVADEIVNFY